MRAETVLIRPRRAVSAVRSPSHRVCSSALQRLGLHWSSLHARHPRLCHVAVVGYPAPREDVPEHDLTYQAEAGLLSPPSLPQSLVADLAGAQRAVVAALALLMGRDRGDGAQYAEVSLAESARLFAEPLLRGLTTPTDALGGGLPTYALYLARDGWIAVAALEPRFREALAQALGVAVIDRDRLAWLFASRSAQEWQQWAETRGLPIVAVRGPAGSNLSDGHR
jgi:alpha-methylacyl-CoA racemase